jgi:hypothetical protein
VVDGGGDEYLEARGHIADEKGEYFVHQHVGHNEIHTQHDRDIEDTNEVLGGQEAEDTIFWVEAELAPSEIIATED